MDDRLVEARKFRSLQPSLSAGVEWGMAEMNALHSSSRVVSSNAMIKSAYIIRIVSYCDGK